MAGYRMRSVILAPDNAVLHNVLRKFCPEGDGNTFKKFKLIFLNNDFTKRRFQCYDTNYLRAKFAKKSKRETPVKSITGHD